MPIADSFRLDARGLLALIGGQICLHACMAGLRMSFPLLVLRDAHAEWAVGLLLGLFALAPIGLALAAGRLADRHGYHRPMHIAVALTVAGGLLAVAATLVERAAFPLLCLGALCAGAGANTGLIAIQRTAGRGTHDPVSLTRIFSWLGLAPALSNLLGPVLAGTLIDVGGFRLAFVALMLLPLASLWWARQVPVEVPDRSRPRPRSRDALSLLRGPELRRLLLVNWLLASSWDVHAFVVPILGHERGLSASAIGLVLGAFAGAVALVRLVIPALAHRLREASVLVGAMGVTTLVFAVYPFARSALAMGACAVLLGLALGAVQPMIMTALHQIVPPERHGEAIALRSMTMNFSSAVMPLLFGIGGAAMGAGTLFWLMAVAVGGGSYPARRVGAVSRPDEASAVPDRERRGG